MQGGVLLIAVYTRFIFVNLIVDLLYVVVPAYPGIGARRGYETVQIPWRRSPSRIPR